MFRQVLLPLGFMVLALSLFTVRSSWAQQNPQAAALACQDEMSDGQQAFVGCWAKQMMSPAQQQVVSCYIEGETVFEYAACSHGAKLSRDQTDVLNCAAQSRGNGPAFAACSGQNYLTPDARQAIGCVEHNSSYTGFGACMAGGQFLTPEQEVAAQCALYTGGEPVSFTTCVGGQLTISELNKCLTIGIGRKGLLRRQ